MKTEEMMGTKQVKILTGKLIGRTGKLTAYAHSFKGPRLRNDLDLNLHKPSYAYITVIIERPKRNDFIELDCCYSIKNLEIMGVSKYVSPEKTVDYPDPETYLSFSSIESGVPIPQKGGGFGVAKKSYIFDNMKPGDSAIAYCDNNSKSAAETRRRIYLTFQNWKRRYSNRVTKGIEYNLVTRYDNNCKGIRFWLTK